MTIVRNSLNLGLAVAVFGAMVAMPATAATTKQPTQAHAQSHNQAKEVSTKTSELGHRAEQRLETTAKRTEASKEQAVAHAQSQSSGMTHVGTTAQKATHGDNTQLDMAWHESQAPEQNSRQDSTLGEHNTQNNPAAQQSKASEQAKSANERKPTTERAKPANNTNNPR